MQEIETDYLVVGAGASGMAFTDALIASSDAEVVIVDRRHRPGGHWNDDYPFVRLHQPSALYGVVSRPLGQDRIDESGINAGFYERATAAEICDHYSRVLDEHFLPSGRVRFFGMHDHLGNGADGHLLRSRVTGHTTTVRVRRKLVDATYIESALPSTHTPAYTVDSAAVVVTPNELLGLDEPASGFTVIGAGKTSMDTGCWLIEQGSTPTPSGGYAPGTPGPPTGHLSSRCAWLAPSLSGWRRRTRRVPKPRALTSCFRPWRTEVSSTGSTPASSLSSTGAPSSARPSA